MGEAGCEEAGQLGAREDHGGRKVVGEGEMEPAGEAWGPCEGPMEGSTRGRAEGMKETRGRERGQTDQKEGDGRGTDLYGGEEAVSKERRRGAKGERPFKAGRCQ